jgi:hypothetical protein
MPFATVESQPLEYPIEGLQRKAKEEREWSQENVLKFE